MWHLPSEQQVDTLSGVYAPPPRNMVALDPFLGRVPYSVAVGNQANVVNTGGCSSQGDEKRGAATPCPSLRGQTCATLGE